MYQNMSLCCHQSPPQSPEVLSIRIPVLKRKIAYSSDEVWFQYCMAIESSPEATFQDALVVPRKLAKENTSETSLFTEPPSPDVLLNPSPFAHQVAGPHVAITDSSSSNVMQYNGIVTKQRLAVDALSLSRPNDMSSLQKRTCIPPRSPVRTGSSTQMVLGFKKKTFFPRPTIPDPTTACSPEANCTTPPQPGTALPPIDSDTNAQEDSTWMDIDAKHVDDFA